MVIEETVGGVTTEVTPSGVTVTQSDGPMSSQALDVVNTASAWASENPRTAVVVGSVAAVATTVVAYQVVKKLLA